MAARFEAEAINYAEETTRLTHGAEEALMYSGLFAKELWCRQRRGSGLMSEHSFGTAIDVSAIDGAVVSEHWKDKGSKGEKLRGAASVACKHFSNVLTPETNRLHHNHFHLDTGVGFRCDARSKLKLLSREQHNN